DKLIYPEIKKGESFYLKEGEWINTGNTIQEQEVNPLPNNDIEEDTSEQSSSNIVENTTVKSYLQNTSKTNVQGLSSSNTENLPVYILPSLEKIQNNLNNNQPIQLKSGVHVSGNLWVIFLLLFLTIVSTLIINNKDLIVYLYRRIKREIQEYQSPEEYFRR
ncbi:hypothetical protein KC669_01730, partial [Candidatus Dojkabacteria bacterium]|nr:hypothetical protein [Candidatus Dojkabacteria bacterium]